MFKDPAKILLPVTVLAIFAALATFGGGGSPKTAEAAARLQTPSIDCSSGTGNALFAWTPEPGATQQWLDLTIFDNGFQPGTFLGLGGMAGNVGLYQLPGLTPGLPHVWRINSLTAGGWVTSESGFFVPCGGPVLLWGPMSCKDHFNATLDFHWAPMADSGSIQYVDLSSDPNFAPGNFAGAGPIAAGVAFYRWEGIPADAWYWFRINNRDSAGNWHATTVGSFYASCLPPVDTNLYASGDSFAGPGISANINTRGVGAALDLLDPAGPWDVVRYDFPVHPKFQGYPGNGGTTILSGHVDYRDCGGGVPCLAVFAPLRNVRVGDIYTYYRADGGVVQYAVDWSATVDENYDYNALAEVGPGDRMILITCDGSFDPASGLYNRRIVVHMTRVA